jgi:hypothetical protein
MNDFDLKDRTLLEAISRIQIRAERNEHEQELAEIFVDRGWLALLQANKNQIVLGRRGTGKTHLLIALGALAWGSSYLYVDCRKLSSAPPRDSNPEQQAGSIFRSIIDRILEWGLTQILTIRGPGVGPSKQAQDAWELLSKMKGNLAAGNRESFSHLSETMEELIKELGHTRLTLVLDEWAAIPLEVQPHLAEWIKRSLFTSKAIAFKFAAIEFQSQFRSKKGEAWIGWEVGADVFADLDMDSYLIYDKDRDDVELFFSQVLFRHLQSEFKSLPKLPEAETLEWITRNLFSDIRAFRELVRACEGVTRDFLQIFTHSFAEAFFKRHGQKLDIPGIRDTAAVWYRRDKQSNISEDTKLLGFLEALVTDVIAKKKARTFLVEQKLTRHPLIQKLFDSRLIHLMRRGYSHKGQPGVRFDIFRLDYGTYVDLIGTHNAPEMDMFGEIPKDEVAEDFVVPFDDYRSIRRILVDESLLKKFS